MLAVPPYAGIVRAAEAIARAIHDRGPIPFDEYMDLALYGDDGYYDTPPIGPLGDFVTAPHVHPVFAELLGRAIVDLHGLLGSPARFHVAEIGAGDGTLARELLPHLAQLDVRYTAVERSGGAREALARLDGVEVADRSTDEAHLVLANELLDNLPFRRFRGTAEGTCEVLVDLEGDRFVERLVRERTVAPELADGEGWVLPTGALAFVDELPTRLARPGAALLIDYAAAGGPGDPVHGYRDHRPVDDLLADPGSTDITAGVDLELLAERAETAGLTAHPPVTQRHALTSLGFDRWIRDELARQTRSLDRRDGIDAVRTWSGRSRATLLVDPTGLGRLQWLLLTTPGVPPPAWV
jgi:NADH dehydrogenase [ubiquinone] 1 alpha subcomplex assembly factor 7